MHEKKIKAQQGKCAPKFFFLKINLKRSGVRVSAREKKLGHSRVSEKQDNSPSDARKKY